MCAGHVFLNLLLIFVTAWSLEPCADSIACFCTVWLISVFSLISSKYIPSYLKFNSYKNNSYTVFSFLHVLFIVLALTQSIYTSQNLIRITQCKFPLQNIKISCKNLTKVRIWNRFSVPHSGYKAEHFEPKKNFGKKNMFLTKNHKFLEFSKSLS